MFISSTSRLCSVHLHARGDAVLMDKTVAVKVGSPPRAWRRSSACRPRRRRTRFTSTRVETLPFISTTLSLISVHLHARGDADEATTSIRRQVGSPPRAWRRCRSIGSRVRFSRFTSTRVETLIVALILAALETVHLHARGDASNGAGFQRGSPGSPPRAWRRSLSGCRKTAANRFTSTRVETLTKRRPRYKIGAVHLHARGDAPMDLLYS